MHEQRPTHHPRQHLGMTNGKLKQGGRSIDRAPRNRRCKVKPDNGKAEEEADKTLRAEIREAKRAVLLLPPSLCEV